jgi:hypothetical protein
MREDAAAACPKKPGDKEAKKITAPPPGGAVSG